MKMNFQCALIVFIGALGVQASAQQPVNARIQTSTPPAPVVIKKINSQNPNRPMQVGRHKVNGAQAVGQDSSFTALDDKEVAWLEQQGFPTRERMAELQKHSAEELKLLSRNRNAPDVKLTQGFNALRQGNLLAASTFFQTAATDGSLYAIEMLAYTQMKMQQQKQSKRITDEITAQYLFLSYMQAAADLGDHRVIPVIKKLKRIDTSATFDQQVKKQAQIFVQRFAQQSKAYPSGRQIQKIERPNRAQWERLEKNPQSETEIIVR